MTPRFTISILTYTALPQAKRCIASVLKSTVPYYLYLTANGSQDALIYFQSVAAEYPNVWVVSYGENQGFIAPNKHLFGLCNTEFYVMLNDDATVPPDWLEKMAAKFDHDSKVAIVGQRASCGSLDGSFQGYRGSRHEYVEFSCAAVRTEIMRELGLFSDYIEFANCEDSDASLRAREAGYHIACAEFWIQHEVGATRKNVAGLAAIYQKNLAACQARWADYLKSKDRLFPCER